jgi:two-component system NarL family response regulator
MIKPDMCERLPITVMIVDDHPVVREGLNAILSCQEDLRIVGEAGTGEEAIALYFRLRPQVVLMDLGLPDMSGSEAIRRICEKSSDARIVVLTILSGDEEVYRALEAGAHGYLLKDMVRQELVRAIHEVHAGRRYIPAEVGARLAEGFPRPQLSPREVEVLQLVATGLRNKEIAGNLDLSEATVNAHVKHILSKLNAADRTEAVMAALRRGILHL